MKHIRRLGVFLTQDRQLIVISAIVTAYVGAYQTQMDNWSIFKDHARLHSWVFASYIFLSVPVTLVRWKRSTLQKSAAVNAEKLFMSFLEMVGRIVSSKNSFLQHRMKTSEFRSDRDCVCTDEQILTILQHSIGFLREAFDLPEGQVDIAVKEKSPDSNSWSFIHGVMRRQGSANAFFQKSTTASHCIDVSQTVFFPSKKAAEKANYYVAGQLDKKFPQGDGSIFCHPVRMDYLKKDWQYVISIVSYGKRFCDPDDDASIQKVTSLLREISRRLELELTLRTVIKS